MNVAGIAVSRALAAEWQPAPTPTFYGATPSKVRR